VHTNYPRRLKVAVFAGGRGSASISTALASHPLIDLSILVNAYDDGLSTGRLRQFVPGMLGPSDIRKNFSTLILEKSSGATSLKTLLEHRFPVSITREQAVELLENIAVLKTEALKAEPYNHLSTVSLHAAQKLARWTRTFLEYLEAQEKTGQSFDFTDCSLGNIFFAGCYIEEKNDFNRAIQTFSTLHPIPARVLNVTAGEGLCLVGLKSDGSYLQNESELVSKQSPVSIADIYLLESYLSPSEREALETLPAEKKESFLSVLHRYPKMNPEVESVLREADVIIYGPGTQHSSLLPSYLTQGIAEAIQQNEGAEKIFIANIRRDHEIQSDTAESLAGKLLYFLNRKGTLNISDKELVSRWFFQRLEEGRVTEYLGLSGSSVLLSKEKTHELNWEQAQGVHLGGKVLEEVLAIANQRIQANIASLPYMISLIVPGLNEERTVGTVLHDLTLLNLQPMGVSKEIIYVDGGSSDNSMKLAQEKTSVRCYQLPKGTGRGEALRYGISKAQGDLVLFFPSDSEYAPDDLFPLIKVLVEGEFPVVFGSRAIKCVNISDRIRSIYAGNTLGYWASKYGGMLLSVLSLCLYNRFVSDPLTGIKGFQTKLLKQLNLVSKGMSLETEIVAKLGGLGIYILELPVDYYPRKKSEGKKSTLGGGIMALLALIRFRFWSPRAEPKSLLLAEE
jgi:2-phospho-L-lactate transferase/gluconeogenesis factor (CofD/UPF0052 family)